MLQASRTIKRIALKEITLFFASPVAYVFLATFAAVTLFVFFWGQAFFARNIADVRPLFEWMPILLIFLSATLTMRLWSEERRTGTLEYVLTQPAPLWHFVVGKFIACLFLLKIALLITLPLPLTVAYLGDLDWGPVVAGYIATILMGAAYLSIGLFVSARSSNQIVSMIVASTIGGLFYLLGTTTITDFFGNRAGEWLRWFGMGARFDAITRGVLDLRDLYYYLSIIVVFITLNTFTLEKERWSKRHLKSSARAAGKIDNYHYVWRLVSVLLIVNVLIANLWLGQLTSWRIDVTEGKQYSISEATQQYINQLQEPLLLRGYFSSKTHPLLAPLVPQLRDLMREYEIVGNGKVRVEFIDPQNEPELEEEANQKYGIQPVPFQVADRYQSSIVSSYFNVLVHYGDEYEVLAFRDLIEVGADSETSIDVQLRNPEHDLTRAIKKVLNSYQAAGNLFDTVQGGLQFTGYFSTDDRLPEQLSLLKKEITAAVEEMAAESNGRLQLKILDPDSNNGEIGRQIAENYGFEPMATSLFDQQRFYFYMTLSKADQLVQIPLTDMQIATFERNLQAAVKRFASGFTKTVALALPNSQQPQTPYGYTGGPRFNQLESFLGAELNVVQENLDDGRVSGEADILVLAAPESLDAKAVFAVDQFLMRGGTLLLMISPYSAQLANRSLQLQPRESGLKEWLLHHGLSIEPKLVLDPQNAAFPVPVTRSIGGLQFQEIRMLDYPFFIDIRQQGLNSDNLITSELPQVTLAWASPIIVDDDKNKARTVTELLHSTPEAWLSDSLDIMPKITEQGLSTFAPTETRGRQLLGVISEGQFDSYFSGQSSPLLDIAIAETDSVEEIEDENSTDIATDADQTLQIDSVIERSSTAARIILISSNDFMRDEIIRLVSSAQRSEYLNTLQLIANAIDWSLEDTNLLSIRSRGQFNRTLPPMEQETQMFWEYLNYGLAALALIIIALIEKRYRRWRAQRYQQIIAQ